MNRVLKSGIKTRNLGETANTLEVTVAMIAALRFTRVLYRHG